MYRCLAAVNRQEARTRPAAQAHQECAAGSGKGAFPPVVVLVGCGEGPLRPRAPPPATVGEPASFPRLARVPTHTGGCRASLGTARLNSLCLRCITARVLIQLGDRPVAGCRPGLPDRPA